MRIVYLLESTVGLWGGVKAALEAANLLHERGHAVTVLSRTGPPPWMEMLCGFETVPAFTPAAIPPADLVIGTFWTTVPPAVQSGRGRPVHYCQGYEGDNPENVAFRDRIDAVYRVPDTHKMTISGHLTRLLRERFGWDPLEVTYAVDHRVMFPGADRGVGRPVRVGLVGPWEVAWKDIATGMRACALAHRAGLDLEVVRITNTDPHPEERDAAFPVEWHVRVPPAEMGALYRSMDVFVGSSRGHEEGFFLPSVEAMACGVPCVLTDIPCYRGYSEEDYALFVPPRDPVAMAEAIVRAAHDPARRAALRAAGLGTAALYHQDRHVAALEQAFSAILARDEVPRPVAVSS